MVSEPRVRTGDDRAGNRADDRTNDRGYALLLSMLVLLALSAAAFMVIAQMHMRMNSALDEARNVHVRVLVDSGVSLTLARLSEDRFFDGVFEEQLNGGRVRCKVRILSGQRRMLTLRAQYGGEIRTYHAGIQIPPVGAARVESLRIGEPPSS